MSAGTNTCLPCKAGRFKKRRQDACERCPPGTFSAEGATQCTECPAGTSLAANRNGCIDACPPGTELRRAGTLVHTCNCMGNTAGAHKLSTDIVCKECGAGEKPMRANKKCECVKGFGRVKGKCIPCPPGPKGVYRSVCLPCEAGTFSVRGALKIAERIRLRVKMVSARGASPDREC